VTVLKFPPSLEAPLTFMSWVASPELSCCCSLYVQVVQWVTSYVKSAGI